MAGMSLLVHGKATSTEKRTKTTIAHTWTHVHTCPGTCSSLQLDGRKNRKSSESLFAMDFLPVVIGFAKYFKE